MNYILTENNYPNLIQAFTTKAHGNMSFSREQNQDAVRERYYTLAKDFNIQYEDIVTIHQVHGTDVFVVKHKTDERPSCDAIITNVKGICLLTIHADCVPVYFYDPVNNCIGIAHSGWRGTLNRICDNVISKMKQEYGSKSRDIKVTIGPCICKDCFNVQHDVFDQFNRMFKGYDDYIIKDGMNISLSGIIMRNMLEAGVLECNIQNMNICTMHSIGLYSHRRNTVKNENDLGAIAAFTFIKE